MLAAIPHYFHSALTLHDVTPTDAGAMTISVGSDGELQLSGDDVVLHRGVGVVASSAVFKNVDGDDVVLHRGVGVVASSAVFEDVDGGEAG